MSCRRKADALSYRLLVLDDDRANREILQWALSDSGYVVSTVSVADEAIEAIRRNPPDLFVTDVDHPGLDGFKLTREIRRSSQLPIILLTSRGDTESVVRGLESGADGYVTKPIELCELRARIRSVLRRCRPTIRQSA